MHSCTSVGGRSSHKGKATKIAELYWHLDSMGLKWDSAAEEDIIAIRNAMLCWDKNNNESRVGNDAMNHKLDIWFKFYRYMTELNISNDMVLSTRKVKKYSPKGLLEHLGKRSDIHQDDFVNMWSLKVKPSPKKNSYHALSRAKFSKLRLHLRNIDLVYEVLAIFMVETGLRISAALEAKEDDFKGLLLPATTNWT
jgi:integrase